ncbi:MAG: hypothetical protein ACI9EF_001060 [Pseudohongiellaceae bacterium]|jgi:hypothetical protein
MTSLAKLSTADLNAELARREKAAGKLHKQRAQLVAQLQALEKELGGLGVAVSSHSSRSSASSAPSAARSSGGGKRPKNSLPLPDAIVASMEVGAVVSPKEAAELVVRNGYNTTSKTFGGQVANVLAKDPRFKKMGRAQFKRAK